MIGRCELEVNIILQGGSHQKNCTIGRGYEQEACRLWHERTGFLYSIAYICSVKLCMVAVTPLAGV